MVESGVLALFPVFFLFPTLSPHSDGSVTDFCQESSYIGVEAYEVFTRK